MKKIIFFLLLFGCTSTNVSKEFSKVNQKIKGFEVEIFFTKADGILNKCDVNLVVVNKDSELKTLYIEIRTFGRKDQNLGVVNFLLNNLSKDDKIGQKKPVPKAKFCNTIKRIEIFGG
tara:strand:- start:33 stop:386 length:354 start_codon:yes stop_codon:yes gene_type:complete